MEQSKLDQVRTIHTQLYTMDKNLMWCLGSKNFVASTNSKDQPTLTFKVNGVKHKGYVSISLDEGRDLYDIRIYSIRKVKNSPEYKETVKYEAISQFVEDLPGILEEYCY